MGNDCRVTVTVTTVPHPNSKATMDLIANLVLKNYLNELEIGEETSDSGKAF